MAHREIKNPRLPLPIQDKRTVVLMDKDGNILGNWVEDDGIHKQEVISKLRGATGIMIDSVTDGSIERLAVDAVISGSGASGTWDYTAGSAVAVSSLVLAGSKQVFGIRLRADAASTFNIDGGLTISLKKNEVWVLNPSGTLIDPTFNWLTGTIEYFVEHVS